MTAPANLLFLVDDDISTHQRIERLLPPGVRLVSSYSAVQALDRCRQMVREQPAARLVLVLDFRLPDFDGALLAAKLREIVPDAPIISLSSLRDAGRPMQVSGMTRTLTKSLSDQELAAHLAEVIAEPLAVPPDPALSPYFAGYATTLALRGSHGAQAALLASSRPLLQLLADACQQAEVTVGAQSISAPALDTLLGTIQVTALVCDGPAWGRARALAERYNLPLLVVALSLSVAIGLSIEPVAVLVAPEASELRVCLERVHAGDRYRDPRIVVAYEALELSQTERQILPFIVRDLPVEQVEQALHLSASAVRKLRQRTLSRLGAEGVDDARRALDELLVR
jgi:FixJ family two-component response regulator